jgi:succinyl-diaminopimelate desuccinylase
MKELEIAIESLKKPMVETLRKWLKIPSVKSEASSGAPFGTAALYALETAIHDCEELGLKTQIFDGYIGHADMGEGRDEDALAILVHLDVVPAGDGWDMDPFGAVIDNNRLYGRGTTDDKGPAAAALFAMRAVQLSGIPLKRKVRLILGCDEESGWADIAYYKSHAVMPDIGFSPDACYPVINIEKGLCHLSLDARPDHSGLKVLSLHAGERVNVIPGTASALVEGDKHTIDKVKKIESEIGYPLDARMEDGKVRITATGITGHAAIPEIARNAIGQLLTALKLLGAKGPLETLADTVGMEAYGQSLGISVSDGMSGKLTCNLGILHVDTEKLYATLDIRYPVLTNTDEMLNTLRTNLHGIDVTVNSLKKPHHVSEKSQLVQELLNAYHFVTGREKKAIAIGGGTYARSLKEGVAFGATFPDEEELAHQANEYMNLDSLFINMKIFAYAIINLAGK